MRRLKLKVRTKLVGAPKKVERREAGREKKAEKAARLEDAITKELVARLHAGTYSGSGLYLPEKAYNKVLDLVGETEELEDDEEEKEEEDEEEEEGEMEMEEEDDEEAPEYVADFGEDDEDEGDDLEDSQRTCKGRQRNICSRLATAAHASLFMLLRFPLVAEAFRGVPLDGPEDADGEEASGAAAAASSGSRGTARKRTAAGDAAGDDDEDDAAAAGAAAGRSSKRSRTAGAAPKRAAPQRGGRKGGQLEIGYEREREEELEAES